MGQQVLAKAKVLDICSREGANGVMDLNSCDDKGEPEAERAFLEIQKRPEKPRRLWKRLDIYYEMRLDMVLGF